ncbi:YdeI/OmpD-associated family protein [Actinospongicola halichondriae]|uniref:YdeI/OmpD-associated family protein n=1 Tax=Actinospongicola halichondriae TaxID=3236844 RepID=UPI003D567754
MRFRSEVEPPEPMKGLLVPVDVVEALGGGKRPRVTVTLNGHSWRTRIAILRGRHLIGLSKAHRSAAGVSVGDQVDVEVEIDTEPVTVAEPEDVVRALDTDPVVRAAYDRLTLSQRKQHIRVIESAKRPDTRLRRIDKLLATLRGDEAD